MDFVKVEDEVLLTRRDGEASARPLVLINALGTDLRVWDRLTRYLTDRFYVVRYDMRGQGLSTIGDAPLDAERLAGDLARLMDQLDIGPAVLVGVELGALVALTLSRARPELVQALILLGAGCRLDTPEDWRERARRASVSGLDALADETLANWLPDAFRAQRPDEARIWRTMFQRSPTVGYVAGCGVLAAVEATAAAAALRVPVLVLSGAASSASRRDQAAALATTIPGAESDTIAEAGLLAHVAQPAPVAALMLAFLERHGLE